MRADLILSFGKLPPAADNLEIVGTFSRRFEDHEWATVWPDSGVVRWSDGSIEIETIWVGKNLKDCGDFNSRWSWLPRKRHGRFFNLSLFWSFGYYHWICDVLTRLHTVLPRLTSDVQVILPPRMTAWQNRSLELIGLPRGQCVLYAGKRPWKIEHLFYASPVAMTGDHEINSLRWVRDTIWQRCLGGPPARAGWRKLYLVRKQTGSRNVVNEAELLPILVKRGFEVVDCAQLNFDQQVQLFSEAACVVGPHGAALTNVLWTPTGAKIFEIFEPSAVRRCYWTLCRTLGHQHACGIAESVPNENGEPNIRVNPREFESALAELLGGIQ